MNKKQIKALKALQDITERSTFYLKDWNRPKNAIKNSILSKVKNGTPKTERIKLIQGKSSTNRSSLKQYYHRIMNEGEISIQHKQKQLIRKQQESKPQQYYEQISPQNKNLLPISRMSLPFIKSSKALRYAQKLDIRISHQPNVDQDKLQFLKQIKRQRFIAKIKRNQRSSQPIIHSGLQQLTISQLESNLHNRKQHESQQKYQKLKQRISRYKRSKRTTVIQQKQRKQIRTLDIQLKKEEANNDIQIMKNWMQGRKSGRKSLNSLLKQHFQLQCRLKKQLKIKSQQKKLS